MTKIVIVPVKPVYSLNTYSWIWIFHKWVSAWMEWVSGMSLAKPSTAEWMSGVSEWTEEASKWPVKNANVVKTGLYWKKTSNILTANQSLLVQCEGKYFVFVSTAVIFIASAAPCVGIRCTPLASQSVTLWLSQRVMRVPLFYALYSVIRGISIFKPTRPTPISHVRDIQMT